VPVFYPFNLVVGIILIVGGVLLFRGLRSWRKLQSSATNDQASSAAGNGPADAGAD
jgi:hypothetical protein